jgi:hypothetical protein
MVRASSDYMTRHAGNLASLEHGFALDLGLIEMEKDVRAKAKAGETPDAEMAVLRHLREHLEVSRNMPSVPSEVGWLSTMASIWYMASPSAFLVQLSQMGVTALPKMAASYGITKSLKAMSNSLFGADSKRLDFDALVHDTVAKDLYDQIYATATEEDVENGVAASVGDKLMSDTEVNDLVAGLSQDDRHALLMLTALRRNMVGTTYANEAIELASGDESATKITSRALWFMKKGEDMSRRTAVLSGFDLAYENGATKGNWEESLRYSQSEINTGTMFDYSKEAKPLALIKSPTIRMATQFRYFQISLIARLARLSVEAMRGADPAVKSASRRELAYMMGTTGVLAGTAGMPIAGAAFLMADTMVRLLGDDEEDEFFDSRAEFRKMMLEGGVPIALANTVESGALGVVGADVSQRIGLTDTIPFLGEGFTPAHLEGRSKLDYNAAKMLGPSYSVARDFIVGAGEVQEGKYLDGLMKMSPKGMRDVLKSYRYGEKDGVVTSSGKRLTEGTEMWDMALLAVGIMPHEYVQPLRREGRKIKISVDVARQKARLADAYAEAYLARDAEGMVAARNEAAAWSRKHPTFAVSGSDFGSSIKDRLKKERGIPTKAERRIESLL